MAISVGIGITNDCNLDCAHCYRPQGQLYQLELDEIRSICERLEVGSFNFGTGDIDNEYGLTAHVGTMIGQNSMLFVRGGYQWVDLDFDGLAEKTADGFNFQGQDRQDFINAFNNSAGDDTAGDYLVGVRGEFGLGQSTAFRVTVDTISFDTVRVGGGMTFRF